MAINPSGMVPLIQVYDMPAALAFYRDVLGFGLVEASPEVDTPEGRFSHWVWLRLGPVDLMLNTAYDAGERPAARDPAQQRWHGDTGLFFSCADVDEVYRNLLTKLPGLSPPKDSPHGMRELYVHDPDGYGISFHSPLKGS